MGCLWDDIISSHFCSHGACHTAHYSVCTAIRGCTGSKNTWVMNVCPSHPHILGINISCDNSVRHITLYRPKQQMHEQRFKCLAQKLGKIKCCMHLIAFNSTYIIQLPMYCKVFVAKDWLVLENLRAQCTKLGWIYILSWGIFRQCCLYLAASFDCAAFDLSCNSTT